MVPLAGVRLRQGEAGLLGWKGSCGVLGALVLLLAFQAAPALAGSGPTVAVPLLAGAPTIDGVQGAPEWDGASATSVSFGAASGTLYVGRDANNLYVALKVTDPNGTTPSTALYFDNNDDGVRAVGDDLWDTTGAGAARDWFVSDVSPSGFSVQQDTFASGMNNTTAAQSFSSGVYFVEFKHPLCSGDTGHDLCVTLPAQVGFVVLYAPDGQTGSEWPAADLFSVGAWANLKFLPSNGRIVYDEMVNGQTEVFSANPDGTHARQLTSDPGRDEGAQYSPDGKTIIWASDRSGSFRIYAMNAADGSNVHQIPTDFPASVPTYSPDGSKIAFVASNGGDSDIYVMNADGTGQADITNTASANDGNPTWSPDGKKIAYSEVTSNGSDIFVTNADGTGTPVDITSGEQTAQNHDPSWSPDGTKIAYVASFDTNANNGNGLPTIEPQVLVMNADGSNRKTISDTSSSTFFSADPSWSPDGTKVVYSFSDDSIDGFNDFEIYSVNADGTGRAKVTSNTTYDGFPFWGTEAIDTSGGGGGGGTATRSTPSTPSSANVRVYQH